MTNGDARHNGGMGSSRVRLDLIAHDDASADARVWTLRADGSDVGTLRGEARGGDAVIEIAVEESARRRGIARRAVGRLLGMSPWGRDVRYVACLDPADTAGAALAVALGFAEAGPAPGGRREWSRPAPRARAGADDITRFLDTEGRIDRYPLRDGDRRALLRWVAVQALPEGAVLDEARVNELLEPYAPGGDVAVLRRYLVDHELVERTRSGSEYLRLA